MTAWTSDPPEREGWYWVHSPVWNPAPVLFHFGKLRQSIHPEWLIQRDGYRSLPWGAEAKLGYRRSVAPEPPK